MVSRRQICTLMLCLVGVLCLVPAAFAQRSPGSEVELLRREEVQDTLQLSDAQKQKLAELKEKSSNTRQIFEQFKERLREAEGDEQEKVREEMNAAIAKNRSLFNDKAADVLTKDQRIAMRRMYLQSAGVRGLLNEDIAKEFQVTDDQSKKLSDLFYDRRVASRKLGFDASDEEREAFTTEWDEKFMAVLNEKQKAMFEKQSGDLNESDSPVVSADSQPAASRGPIERPVSGPAVGSFGAAVGKEKLVTDWTFNFRGMPWEDVLQMYADGTGLTLELDAVPPGTFNHIDSNIYGPRKTLDIINGNLLRRGHVAIENDGFLIVKNIDKTIESYLLRNVTIEELIKVSQDPVVGDHELVTVTFDLESLDAGRIAQELEPLIGPHGSLVAITESRILIVTDTGGSLRRIHGYLQKAAGQIAVDAQIFKPYPLKYIDAEEAQLQVMTQFGMQQNTVDVSFAAEMARRQQFRSRSSSSSSQSATAASSPSSGPQVQIATDLRLNRLLVTGTQAQHSLVESIVKSLDINETADGQTIGSGRRGTYMEVYKVTAADVLEVAKTIAGMNINGVKVINEDTDAQTLHVMATARKHEEVAALVRQLDGAAGSTASGSVAVIPLSQLDPISAAATLRSLFFNLGDEAPTIETDLYGRRLIIRGSVEAIAQIRQVLADLGEDGSGIRQRSGEGLIRRYPLNGRNPKQFLDVFMDAWKAQDSTKINLIMPKPPSPIRSRETTDQPEADFLPNNRPAGNSNVPQNTLPSPANRDNVTTQWPLDHQSRSQVPNVDNNEWPRTQWPRNHSVTPQGVSQPRDFITTRASQVVSRSQTQARRQADESTSSLPAPAMQAGQADKPDQALLPPAPLVSPQAGNQGDQIDIIVNGDELIFASENQDKLDLMEDLLDQLHQSIPFRKEYTVVYLRSAEAVQAADMLSQFFPSSSVAATASAGGGGILESLSNTIGGLGSDLADASGLSGLGAGNQSLTIIPDTRQNALWLTGPQSMIDDAKQFLNVLDSSDLPNSLKDLQPHFIPVKFADVRDVEAKIKEVFRTYTEAQNSGNQRNANPLAMLGLGGSGGSKNDQASQVRLLVDSDEQTSTLIVNCNDSLFKQIEVVVERIDMDTMKANPIVRTIPLMHADPTVIQQTLLNMVPRVSVSSSRTGGSNNSSTSRGSSANGGRGNTGGAANGGGADVRAQQEFMQRLFQQRAAGGGGRGAGGGGRGAGFNGFGGFGNGGRNTRGGRGGR